MLLQTSRFLLVGCWPINCTRGATAVPSSAAIHTSRKRSRGGVRRVRASAYAPRYTGTGQVPKKKPHAVFVYAIRSHVYVRVRPSRPNASKHPTTSLISPRKLKLSWTLTRAHRVGARPARCAAGRR